LTSFVRFTFLSILKAKCYLLSNFSREFKCRKTRKEKTKYVELFTKINIPLHIVQRRKRKKNGKGIYFQFSRKGQFQENFTALDCNCSVFRHKIMLFSMSSKTFFFQKYICAAGFALLNLPKGKSLGRSKPETNSSNEQAH
jgi:hypothetical protein